MLAYPGKQCIWISKRCFPLPASNAFVRTLPICRNRQAGHPDIQMLLSVTGKQGICIYSRVISRPVQIPASRASVRTSARSAAVPDTGKQCICAHSPRFAVTGKLGICAPNTKNDRFPEIGKRSFCLPGLLGKSPIPSCAIRHSCAIFAKSLPGDGRRITKSSSRRCTSFVLSRSAQSRRQSPPAGQASRGFLQKCRRRFR